MSTNDPVSTGRNSSRRWYPSEKTSTVYSMVQGPVEWAEVQGRVLRSMVS